jgi:hypothetical protein
MPDPIADSPSATRGLDHGPFYTETPQEIRELKPYPGAVAEPWNAVTASFFIIIALAWVVYLRGRLKNYPFLAIALPILLVGGIGGTLYHGTRSTYAYFLMDVIPIYLLGLTLSVVWWIRLGPRLIHLLSMVGVLVLMQLLGWRALPTHWAINVSYALLALIMIIPLVLVLIRTRCRHVGWVATALVSFGIAWFFRIGDTIDPPILPMGTHWLWHTFGAITTAAVSIYVYKLEGLSLRRPVSRPATPL